MGPRAGVGFLWKRKISYPCRDLNHNFWAVFARLNFELGLLSWAVRWPSDKVNGSGFCNFVTNISWIPLLIFSNHRRITSDQNNCPSFRVTLDRPPGSYFLLWNVWPDSAPFRASFGLSNFATCRRFVFFEKKNNCLIFRSTVHWRKVSSNDKHDIVFFFLQFYYNQPRWVGGARFSTPVQTGPGAHPSSCTVGTGSLLGIKKRPGRDVDPSPTSNSVGHERVELYLYSPYGPYGLYRASVPVQGWPLPLPIYRNSVSLYNIHSYMFRHFYAIIKEYHIRALLSYIYS